MRLLEISGWTDDLQRTVRITIRMRTEMQMDSRLFQPSNSVRLALRTTIRSPLVRDLPPQNRILDTSSRIRTTKLPLSKANSENPLINDLHEPFYSNYVLSFHLTVSSMFCSVLYFISEIIVQIVVWNADGSKNSFNWEHGDRW